MHLGAVPAFPLLAAVPSSAAPWQIMALFVAAVVGAGVAAGLRIAAITAVGLNIRLRLAAITGLCFGLAVIMIVGFAGGPGGPGRLASVGPSPWQVGFATAAEIGVVALIVVLVSHYAKRMREVVIR